MGHAPWWRRLWNAVRFTQAGAVPGRPELAPLEADQARLLKERVVVVDAFIDDTVAPRTIAQLLFLEDQDARKGSTPSGPSRWRRGRCRPRCCARCTG